MAPYAPPNGIDYYPLTTQNEHPRDDRVESSDEQVKATRRRTPWERVQLLDYFILLLGSVIIALVMVLLGFFWNDSIAAASGQIPKTYWARIVNAGWATRLITISTAVIRTVVAFQASLLTAMVAAIALEAIGVPLLRVPFYSILRTLSVSPMTLLAVTAFPRRTGLSVFVYALVATGVLVAVASQLLSTIYLSDFGDGTILQTSNLTSVGVLGNRPSFYTEWFAVPSLAAWTFAEYSEPFTEGPDFHDTGHTYRVFLPFEAELQRTRLREFRGPAPVVDHQVVCVAPSLISLKLDWTSLSGQIALGNRSYPMLNGTETQPYIDFKCFLPIQDHPLEVTERESSMCYANSGKNWTVSLKDSFVGPREDYPLRSQSPNNLAGHRTASTMLMILDITSSKIVTQSHGENGTKAVRQDGPWAIVANNEGNEGLRVTACITNPGVGNTVVKLHTSSDSVEPTLGWDIKLQDYNTEAIRRQLGASLAPVDLRRRGVLKLEEKPPWQDVYAPSNMVDPFFFTFSLLSSVPNPAATEGYTGIALSRNLTQLRGKAHKAHVAVFQDTLHDTGSPALATQALLARIYQVAYYDQIVKLNATTIVSTAFSTTTSVPVRWTGFIAGTALLAAHFIVMVVVTILFVFYTKHSLVGDSWQAISQVVSRETQPILEQADTMKDQEIRRWAKQQPLDPNSVSFLRQRADGRIVVGTAEYDSCT